MFKNVPTVNVTGLTFDSRKVKPGDMYFCLPGLTFDGHDFIDQAIEAGAIAVVHSKPVSSPKPGAVYIKVEDVTAAMNQASRIFYNRPSDKMEMFGITGTNGKSTMANIIRHIETPENPCGYIGTIEIAYGNTHLAPDLTTPDAITLQKILRDMSDAGMKKVAMEVSSHGLAQHRVDGIDYDVAIFTNLTYDHLDFHGTMEKYFEAKTRLFTDRLSPEGVAVLNRDDEKYEELKKLSVARTVSYGIDQEADYRAENVEYSTDGIRFDLHAKDTVIPVQTNLLGKFNLSNLLGAIAAVDQSASGLSLQTICERCANIPQIAGRLERINEGQKFNVIVDFAHTPDGMEKVFQFGKTITKPGHKLTAVFGSAGKRDKAKRKIFGELADKYCTSVILTEDDPRDEDPKAIAAEIKSGIQNIPSIFVPERYEAIRQAIESAGEGDTVLLLGKGDEPYIYRENGRAPYIGDNTAAKECLRRLQKPENAQSNQN